MTIKLFIVVTLWFVLTSAVANNATAYDKMQARKKGWRVSEKTLQDHGADW